MIFIKVDVDVIRQKYKRGSFSVLIKGQKKTNKKRIRSNILFPTQFEWVADHTMETVTTGKKKTTTH